MYHRVPPELLVNPSAIVVLQIIDSSRIDPVNFTLWRFASAPDFVKHHAKLPRKSVRRQNLVDLKLPELRETLAHQVVLMLITVMHLLAERQGL